MTVAVSQEGCADLTCWQPPCCDYTSSLDIHALFHYDISLYVANALLVWPKLFVRPPGEPVNATSMQRTVLGQRKRSIQTSKFKIRDYTSRHIYTQTTCMLQSSERQKLAMWPLHISMLSCFFNNNFQESTLVHLPLTYNVSFSPVRERMQIYFPHILSRHDSESTALCTPCRAQSKLF